MVKSVEKKIVQTNTSKPYIYSNLLLYFKISKWFETFTLYSHDISDFIIVVYTFVILVHEDPAADSCDQSVHPKPVLDTNTLSVHCAYFIFVVALVKSYEDSQRGRILGMNQTLGAVGKFNANSPAGVVQYPFMMKCR